MRTYHCEPGVNVLGGGPGDPERMTVSVLFLTGLHVFPTFVLYELTILMVLTVSVVVMKVPVLSVARDGQNSRCLGLCDTAHLPPPGRSFLPCRAESVSPRQHRLPSAPSLAPGTAWDRSGFNCLSIEYV